MKRIPKIIHFSDSEKFIEPFIQFLEKNFDISCHYFLIRDTEKFTVSERHNVSISKLTFSSAIKYLILMNRAEKIILHGLFNNHLMLMLFFQPWILHKCHWIIWGGDLYRKVVTPKQPKKFLIEYMRASLIRRMGYLLTYIDKDVEFARARYGANGKHYDCLMYPSNLYG